MMSRHRKQRLKQKESVQGRYPWRQWYRTVLLVSILLPLLVFLPLLAMKGYYQLRLQQRFSQFRAQGYPCDQEAFNAIYPPAPEKDNATPLLLESAQLLEAQEAPKTSWSALVKLYPSEALPEDWLARYRLLEERAPAWRKPYLQAQNKKRLLFSSNYAQARKEVIAIARLSLAFLSDAAFAVEMKQSALAVERLEESIRLNALLAQDSCSLDYYASIRLKATSTVLMRLLSKNALDKESLIRLENALEELRYFDQLQRSLDRILLFTQEEIGNKSFEEELRHGRMASERYKKQNHHYEERLRSWGLKGYFKVLMRRMRDGDCPPNPALRALLRCAGLADRDLFHACGDYAAARELLHLRPHLALEAACEVRKKHSFFLQNLAWDYLSILDIRAILDECISVESYVSVCQLAFAVERYRRDHNEALPESLAALTPHYILAIPIDALSGQPLQYRREESPGYTVYSVDCNQGLLFDPRHQEVQSIHYDPVFLVQR